MLLHNRRRHWELRAMHERTNPDSVAVREEIPALLLLPFLNSFGNKQRNWRTWVTAEEMHPQAKPLAFLYVKLWNETHAGLLQKDTTPYLMSKQKCIPAKECFIWRTVWTVRSSPWQTLCLASGYGFCLLIVNLSILSHHKLNLHIIAVSQRRLNLIFAAFLYLTNAILPRLASCRVHLSQSMFLQ